MAKLNHRHRRRRGRDKIRIHLASQVSQGPCIHKACIPFSSLLYAHNIKSRKKVDEGKKKMIDLRVWHVRGPDPTGSEWPGWTHKQASEPSKAWLPIRLCFFLLRLLSKAIQVFSHTKEGDDEFEYTENEGNKPCQEKTVSLSSDKLISSSSCAPQKKEKEIFEPSQE